MTGTQGALLARAEHLGTGQEGWARVPMAQMWRGAAVVRGTELLGRSGGRGEWVHSPTVRGCLMELLVDSDPGQGLLHSREVMRYPPFPLSLSPQFGNRRLTGLDRGLANNGLSRHEQPSGHWTPKADSVRKPTDHSFFQWSYYTLQYSMSWMDIKCSQFN